MSVTEAFKEIGSELISIRVPIALKLEIIDPIEDAVIKLSTLQDAVENMLKKNEEEKEILRARNQELAEQLIGKAAPAEEKTEQKTE